MERKDKACWNCREYKPYYTKGYCCFDKQDIGQCKQTKSTVDKHHVCAFWQSKPYFRYQKEAALRSLNEILEQLVQTRQIIEEDIKEKESL